MTLELDAARIERFRRDGFIIVDRLIEPALAERVRDRYEALFRGEFETGVVPDEVNWRQGESRAEMTRQICNGWRADRTLASVVLREDIGRAGARLAGWPGARLMQDNVLWKPPGTRPLGYHQDESYLEWLSPPELVSCWIALDDTTAEGGTMEVARGSHRWGESPMASEFHGPEAYRAEMQAAAARAGVEPEIVPIVAPQGGGSFHHGRIWHGSGFNRSDRARRSLVVHLCSSESRYALHKLGAGIGRIYGRYRRLGDDRMDENYFPVLWTEEGYRTPSIARFLASSPDTVTA